MIRSAAVPETRAAWRPEWGPPQSPRTSQHYGVERFKGSHQLGTERRQGRRLIILIIIVIISRLNLIINSSSSLFIFIFRVDISFLVRTETFAFFFRAIMWAFKPLGSISSGMLRACEVPSFGTPWCREAPVSRQTVRLKVIVCLKVNFSLNISTALYIYAAP